MSKLTTLYQSVLENLGAIQEEPEFLDLKSTPARVAKMLETELLSSYQPGARDRLIESFTTFPSGYKKRKKGELPGIVVETNIPIYSMCAHHMLPFFGTASVGYVPKTLVAGLSKIPRVVDFFSRKLQMQEKLTEEVADFLMEILKPQGVIVIVECRHCCMELRGIQRAGILTKTSALRGCAYHSTIREEFYRLIQGGT